MKNKWKKIAICLAGAMVMIDTVICAELFIGKYMENEQTVESEVEEKDLETGTEDERDSEEEKNEVVEGDTKEENGDSDDKPGANDVLSPTANQEHVSDDEAASNTESNGTSSTVTQHTTETTTPATQLGLVACINDCGADDALVNQINTYLASTPENIAVFYVNAGWTVHLVQSANSNAYLDYQVRTISIEPDADKQDIMLAMGEFIDCATGYTSYSEDFYAIYLAESEAYKMNMDYTPLSWSDMFCDGVIKYYTMGARLQTSCPMTYSYIAAKLSSIGL